MSPVSVCRSECYFSGAQVVDGSVYVLDASGNAVHVMNMTTRQVIESIKTDPQPHGLYYLPWRKEVWVHSWNLSTFDVIKTDTRNRSHRAIRAHISPGESK